MTNLVTTSGANSSLAVRSQPELTEGQKLWIEKNPKAGQMVLMSRDGLSAQRTPDMQLHAVLLVTIKDALILLGHSNSLATAEEQKLLVRHLSTNIKTDFPDLTAAEIREAVMRGVAGKYRAKPEDVIYLNLPNILTWLDAYYTVRKKAVAEIAVAPEPEKEGGITFEQLAAQDPDLAARIDARLKELAYKPKPSLTESGEERPKITESYEQMAARLLPTLSQLSDEDFNDYFNESLAQRKKYPRSYEMAKAERKRRKAEKEAKP